MGAKGEARLERPVAGDDRLVTSASLAGKAQQAQRAVARVYRNTGGWPLPCVLLTCSRWTP